MLPCFSRMGMTALGLWLLAAGPAVVWSADDEMAQRAQAILKAYCGRCHGPDSPGKGGMNYVLDPARLIARGQVVPGDADHSRLFHRLRTGSMPPPKVKARPGASDIALLRRWIQRGAPVIASASRPRSFVDDDQVVHLIEADLQTVDPRHRRFMRYLSLVPLANAGASDERLATVRRAVAKLLNSLSWQPRIWAPASVDPTGLLLRMDLRELGWSESSWNHVQDAYPYAQAMATAAYSSIRTATRSSAPLIRADWLVANASRAPLYYDLLEMPDTDRALERTLRVDVRRDLDEDRVARAGFNGSGVSRNNRLIERHPAAFGAYWRSYDFSDNTGRQNLFEHPLGPQTGHDGFEQAGGEIIFHLPNGLQGYMLVDGLGRRIERASIDIVSDPERPDRVVEAGLSCMGCHVHGMIPKSDQVRAHVVRNHAAFSDEDAAIVRAQYPPKVTLDALFKLDEDRFLKALAQTGTPVNAVDPTGVVTRVYEGELDLAGAAAEVGLRTDDFAQRLRRSPSLSRSLGALLVEGGTVQRDVFQSAFPDILRSFHLAESATPAAATGPFVGHEGQVLCLAWSPDGKQIISGGEDNTVRLWDAASGRLLRTLRGHEQGVLAVAFAADGKRALSGSADRTVRLWDLVSGRELKSLRGHTDRISAATFTPDGRRALSASWDGTLGLWDLTTGQLLQRLSGHEGYVSSIAIARDGWHAVSGGYDGSVRWWDLRTGNELRRLQGPQKEVYCVALSSDGRLIAAGGNDHDVYVWEIATGKRVQHLRGHSSAIVRVAFRARDRELVSAASQYRAGSDAIRVWDLTTGRQLSHAGSNVAVWSAAFSADGRRAVTVASGKTVRVWELKSTNRNPG